METESTDHAEAVRLLAAWHTAADDYSGDNEHEAGMALADFVRELFSVTGEAIAAEQDHPTA